MRINIQIKDVYGKAVAYPLCTAAKHFASIAKTKTLTRDTIANILGLGFEIIVQDRFGNVSSRFRAHQIHDICNLIAA